MSRPRALLQLTKPISAIRAANKAADEAARKLKEESKQEETKNALQQLLGGYSDSEGEEEEEEGEKEKEEKGKVQNSVAADVQTPPPKSTQIDDDATLADFLSEINSLPLTSSVASSITHTVIPVTKTPPDIPQPTDLLTRLSSLASLFQFPNEFEFHRTALATRMEDYGRGVLEERYFTDKLVEMERVLREAEERIVVTTGWFCTWDEGAKAYYFTEGTTGQTLWTVPYSPETLPYLVYPANWPQPPPLSSEVSAPPPPPPPLPPPPPPPEDDDDMELASDSDVDGSHDARDIRNTHSAKSIQGVQNGLDTSHDVLGWILSAMPPQEKKKKKRKKSKGQKNKALAALVEQWHSVQNELAPVTSPSESGSEPPPSQLQPPTTLLDPQGTKLTEWRRQQTLNGKAVQNANFQPLEMDWRERKRRRDAGED
ncbi:hypothetical protein BC937DRAFT_86581 [Endogone sp. FLAS-F59071]|nr:hypothetical protein BC937DRAFT_86581 [Endogone sp. FLAS-F59071]|eukprot:RUS19997.1 hypothetical protein BC937DRAFT_86581 [Endogone sp. FLAS-F59071]